MQLGAMQDWSLRVTRLIDHAEREHGDGEIVTAWADGSITRTNWREVARDARKMAQALEKLGIKPGEYGTVREVDARQNTLKVEFSGQEMKEYDPRRLRGVAVGGKEHVGLAECREHFRQRVRERQLDRQR